MTPSLSGLGFHVTVADVLLTSVATTSVGVLGDFGPVSSPHALIAIPATTNAASVRAALRIPFNLMNKSLVERILVVPLDDDAPVLLSSDRCRVRSDGRI